MTPAPRPGDIYAARDAFLAKTNALMAAGRRGAPAFMTLAEALEILDLAELEAGAGRGELIVTGLRNGAGERTAIPREAWADFRLSAEHGGCALHAGADNVDASLSAASTVALHMLHNLSGLRADLPARVWFYSDVRFESDALRLSNLERMAAAILRKWPTRPWPKREVMLAALAVELGKKVSPRTVDRARGSPNRDWRSWRSPANPDALPSRIDRTDFPKSFGEIWRETERLFLILNGPNRNNWRPS